MASVYILYSTSLDNFYIGSCKDLSFRIDQHLNNKIPNSYTSKVNDWEIFYVISDLEYEQARKIEKHIKNMKSRIYIQNLKKYPEIMGKLKVKYP